MNGCRTAALALVSALLAMVAGPGPALATEGPPAPELDVAAAIQALERKQVYRAPGAVATYDEELVHAELTPDMRLLVAPYIGQYGPDGNYASREELSDKVIDPLRDWAEEKGVVLVYVLGLSISSSKGASLPTNLVELRQHMAHLDITDALWTVLHYAATGDEGESGAVFDPVVEPTSEQLGELAGLLEENRVYNAPGRSDPVDLPTELIEEKTGFTVRAAALPPVPPGEPLVNYAPALAQRFPDDVILVAHGPWLEVAGPQQSVLESARNYAYGHYLGPMRLGVVMNNRIGSVLLRAEEMLETRAFSRPQPKPLRQVVLDIAPWLLLGSAVLIGGFSLVSWGVRRTAQSRIQRGDLLEASAETYAEIADLGVRLLSPGSSAAAAERHSTAVALFEQARTPEAMAEVREVAREGLLLQQADDERDRQGAE